MSDTWAVVLAVGLNGYGAVRSLHRAGIRTIVVVPDNTDLSARSRYPQRVIQLPMDEQWERRLLELLCALKVGGGAALVGCSDRAAAFLRDFISVLPDRYGVLCPEGDVIGILNDKRSELQRMQDLGVQVPRSLLVLGESSPLAAGLRYPVIVKPRDFTGYEVLKKKNLILHSDQDWYGFLNLHQSSLDRFIAQEVIGGPDEKLWVCNATVDRAHKVVRFFSFRRLGTRPSHFGVTSLAVSECNEVLHALVQRIAEDSAYVGPLMMEFKEDPETGSFVYLETNPRLGMCNWFDTACGVNNVEATCLLALGKTLPEDEPQISGCVFVDALGDLTARLEDREGLLPILRRYGSLMGSRKVWAVLDSADWRPFLASCRGSLGYLWSHGLKRLRRASLGA